MGIFDGFAFLFANPMALFFVALAAIVGIIVGALPGLTAAAAIAMLMPITFYLDPLSALAFLYVIGKSGRFGGSIAAILFNTPGTAASAATMVDGHPMSKQGKATKALKTATVASVFGDYFGDMILIFGAAAIAVYTAQFGPPEYFAIYLMAFVVIGSVVGKSILRGILSTLFGILISLIGLDPITGDVRMTLGVLELESGFSLVPLLIGIFVMSEVLVQVERSARGSVTEMFDAKPADSRENRLSLGEFRLCLPLMLRSSAIGSFIGMMPGLGSAVACFAAYGEARRRHPEKKWGTGIVEGIAAPESANNAVSGPSMIPLLTLGVPGSTIAAILIGVFLIHGIQVGPMIFVTAHDLVFGLFASGLVGIAMYGLIGYFGGPLIGRIIAKVSPNVIYPFIFITAFVASYSARSSLFDVGVMIVFGVVGYLMRRFDYSAAAFIIAFVLAKGAEESFRQSLLLSDSGIGIFLERPIAVAFIAIGLAVLIGRIVSSVRRSGTVTGSEAVR
ncbi:MAG: tripartite tricarboxylate transporter permease [Rhodospirillales bacterium]|nr:tripartite tricarboxylate transporter permease [Rhodospirillales bacterium]